MFNIIALMFDFLALWFEIIYIFFTFIFQFLIFWFSQKETNLFFEVSHSKNQVWKSEENRSLKKSITIKLHLQTAFTFCTSAQLASWSSCFLALQL